MSATFLAANCCCAPICSDCDTLFQANGVSSSRRKSDWRGYPDSQYIFKDYKTIADEWGAYVAPDLDEFDQPIEGTGNPPYEAGVKIYYNRQTCHRILVSPFITGSLDDQTGDFTTDYVLKTNHCGFKPFDPCTCFGEQKRPFASGYDSQTGTLLDTFPYWTGPATTQADCPALSATGAASITSVDLGDCPPDPEVGTNCCRVGGYTTGSAAVLPTWEWLTSRSWWAGPYSNARLILVVGYMTFSKWKKEGATRTFLATQAASDSAAIVTGAFISKEP